MRKCKVCEATETDAEFYASVKTYCKKHWKERVRSNRSANVECYREADRIRSNLPHRVAARAEYEKTDAGKEAKNRARAKYEENNIEAVAAAKRAYKKSDNGIASTKRWLERPATKQRFSDNAKKYREAFPDRRNAHVVLNNAVRKGAVIRLPCFVCGCEKTEAHHPDYSAPLDVVWLCSSHHKQTHALFNKIA